MGLRKIAILILISIILSVQLLIIIPKVRNYIPYKRLWPFQNYAMYSIARFPGDRFTILELYILEGNNNIRRKLTYKDLHIMPKRFNEFVRGVMDKKNDNIEKNVLILNNLIKKYQMTNFFKIEIWGRTYELTYKGLENENVVPTLFNSWEVIDESITVIRDR